MTRHSGADLNAQLLSIHELYSYLFYLLVKAGSRDAGNIIWILEQFWINKLLSVNFLQ
jgi:hypothetical protein